MNRPTSLRLLALLLLLVAGPGAWAQAPAWQSAIIVGTGSSPIITATATDASGNVYMTGFFGGTVRFGSTTLTSAGNADVFVAKINPLSQQYLWAQRAGGPDFDFARALVVSGTSVYVAGDFNGTTSFGSTSLTSVGSADVFVAKLTDAGSTASFTWVQRAGGSDGDYATALAVRGTSVFVAGHFSSPTVSFGSRSLISAGNTDVFVAKLMDAGNTASFTWAQRAGGTHDDLATALAVSGTSVYVAGYFNDTASFGSTRLTSAGWNDVFVAKLTDAGSTGSFTWAQGGGGPNDNRAYALVVSGTSVYVAGYFNGTTSFGSTSLPSAGFNNVFVAKLTDAGSSASFTWAQRAGGSGGDSATATALAVSGTSVYVAGYFYGTASFGSTSLTGAGAKDVFVAQLTDAGSTASFTGAQRAGGTGFDEAFALAVGGPSVYVAGQFNSATADFGPTTLVGPTTPGIDFGFLAALTDPLLPTTAPTLTSVAPASGVVGAILTLVGTNLTGATTVTFPGAGGNTVTAGFTVNPAGTELTGVVVPAGALSGPVTVTTASGTSNGVGFLLDLVVSTAGQAIGGGTYGTITVLSGGTGTLQGAVSAATVVVQAGGTLHTACQVLGGGAGSRFELMAGATLSVCDAGGLAATGNTGAVQTALRSFDAGADYVYTGTGPQVTGTGLPATVRLLGLNTTGPLRLSQPVAIGRELRLTAGTLDLNGQLLTLLSDATGTAQVNQNGTTTTGTVSGASVTVQRYVSAATNAGLGYRHVASPVAAAPVSDLAVSGGYQPVVNSAYNGSATPGTTRPFPTVLGYEQGRLGVVNNNLSPFDQGWMSPAALTDVLVPGRGYAMHLAGGQTMDFTGALQQGTLPVALARNTGPTAPDAGWHLLGNPYASAFDLSSLHNTPGVDNAKYLFRSSGPYAGQYDTYLNGITGVSPLLALGQGFFARVTAGTTAATLTFTNAGRVVDHSPATIFQRGGADTRPLIELTLTSAANGQRDYTVLYAEAGATSGLDPAYDAVKLPNPTGLNLAQAAAGTTLAIQGLPALTSTSSTVVPLTVGVPAAGPYALHAGRLLHVPATTQVFLTDALTGQRLDLRTLSPPGYAFALTAAQTAAPLTGRFFLHLVPLAVPLAAGLARPLAALSVYPNPAHASATVLVPAVADATWATLTLTDMLGRVLRRTTTALTTPTGAAIVLPLTGLAPGIYTLRVQAGAGAAVRRLVVE